MGKPWAVEQKHKTKMATHLGVDRMHSPTFLCLCFFQAAQSVLISLFELNTPEFTMLLGALPKTFQDGATKLLHNHLRNTGNGTQVCLTCLVAVVCFYDWFNNAFFILH